MSKFAVVTGGAGFIGSHLIDALLDDGWKVVAIDNLSTGFKRNVHPDAELRVIDIRTPDAGTLIETLKPDVVFHLAAQASVSRSVEDPIGDAETNVHATLRLLEAASKAHVSRFVFAGTGGALSSEKTKIPTDEQHTIVPSSPYAIAKVAGELYGSFYHAERRLPFVSMRFANVYGPRQNPHGEAGVIAIFTRKMLLGDSVRVNGNGRQTRDFLYVTDAVDALLRAVTHPKAEGPYHVGTGREVSINEMFRMLAKLTDYKKKPVKGPADGGGIPFRSALDSRKIRKELGWKPEMTLVKGLSETVAWFKDHRNEPEAWWVPTWFRKKRKA